MVRNEFCISVENSRKSTWNFIFIEAKPMQKNTLIKSKSTFAVLFNSLHYVTL
jgi:hypothetical protein